MSDHVDIMKSEPTSTAEYRLACVVLDGGRIEIEAPDRDYWRELLRNMAQIDPDEQPDRFLAALHECVDGTYVYATKPHAEDGCPLPADHHASEGIPA